MSICVLFCMRLSCLSISWMLFGSLFMIQIVPEYHRMQVMHYTLEGSSLEASISERMPVKSYTLEFSLGFNLWKWSNFDFSASSVNSGEPYLSSNFSHTSSSPLEGLFWLHARMLTACLFDSISNNFTRRFISSEGETSSSCVTLKKLAFQEEYASGRSLKLDMRVRRRSFFKRNLLISFVIWSWISCLVLLFLVSVVLIPWSALMA